MTCTSERLRGHIVTLKRLRATYRDVLDAGVRAELDAVIAELERRRDRDQNLDFGLAQRAVVVIAAVVEIATNVRDWLR